ncbi:hypothetical protein [Caballeronia sp. ATUFL_M2_KS44]|uniref:hypothetical protein n=1 Tax=Caballeronia sp. ATUFL_M2_KS44 TaxID=2921767 RepID=UPI0020279D26|nr:hypothetical protein [Caballeronia sp. ATUFL_M2_KS44]
MRRSFSVPNRRKRPESFVVTHHDDYIAHRSAQSSALQLRGGTPLAHRRTLCDPRTKAEAFFDKDSFLFLIVHHAIQQLLHLYETLRGTT